MNVVRYIRFGPSEDAAHWARLDGEGAGWVLDGAPWEVGRCAASAARSVGAQVSKRIDPEAVRWLVPTPASKVVCIGQNYRKHAAEMGKPIPNEPLLFLKPSTALNPVGSPIRLPPASQEVHHEAELGLVIGKRLSCASESEAAAAIFGVTCINDVTARDIQRRETQHTRAKSYDTFACAGPVLVSGLDYGDLAVRCRVNGALKQEGRTSDMIFPPAPLVAFISHIMTLLPGDLVSTGTPSGVGPIQAGDTVEVEIEGIGRLWNPVQRGA